MNAETDLGPLDSIPGQLDELARRLNHGDTMREQFAAKLDTVGARQETTDLRVRAMELALGENTAITRENSEITRSVATKMDTHYAMLEDLKQEKIAKKWMKRTFIGAGALAAAGTAIAVASGTAWHWLTGKPIP